MSDVTDRYDLERLKAQAQAEIDERSLFDPKAPVALMFVDNYGRPVRQSNLNRLIREWEPLACHPLVLSLRNDTGKLAVLDGNHRRLAAIRLGIEILPAKVVMDLTYQEEARLFAILNTHAMPTAMDRFRARLEAGEPQAVVIRNTLRHHGLELGLGSTKGRVRAVSALDRVYAAMGQDVLNTAIGLLARAFGQDDRAYVTTAIMGMAAFVIRYADLMDPKRVVDRLRQTGTDALLRLADQQRHANRVTPDIGWGRALRNIYNERLRSGQLPEWPERVVSAKGRLAIAENARRVNARLKAEGFDYADSVRRGNLTRHAARYQA